jgi:hypothetical protein
MEDNEDNEENEEKTRRKKTKCVKVPSSKGSSKGKGPTGGEHEGHEYEIEIEFVIGFHWIIA